MERTAADVCVIDEAALHVRDLPAHFGLAWQLCVAARVGHVAENGTAADNVGKRPVKLAGERGLYYLSFSFEQCESTIIGLCALRRN